MKEINNNKSMLEHIENSLKEKYLFERFDEIIKQKIYYDILNIIREYNMEIINSVFDEKCCCISIKRLGTLNINFYTHGIEIQLLK